MLSLDTYLLKSWKSFAIALFLSRDLCIWSSTNSLILGFNYALCCEMSCILSVLLLGPLIGGRGAKAGWPMPRSQSNFGLWFGERDTEAVIWESESTWRDRTLLFLLLVMGFLSFSIMDIGTLLNHINLCVLLYARLLFFVLYSFSWIDLVIGSYCRALWLHSLFFICGMGV